MVEIMLMVYASPLGTFSVYLVPMNSARSGDSAELLGKAHFSEALIRDIFSIGLLIDAP